MRNDFCSNYLAHHGIMGQKWGVKNGPPYPLSDDEKSSSEKKNSLTDKQKIYLKAGATIAATALLAYGAYRIGSPKLGNAIINTGKQTTIPYLKMNLQYFSGNKNKDYPVYSDGGCKFRNKEELVRAEKAFHKNNLSKKEWNQPTLIKSVQTDDKKYGAYQYHAYKSIDDDKFKIFKKVHIKDSAVQYYERNNNDKK